MLSVVLLEQVVYILVRRAWCLMPVNRCFQAGCPSPPCNFGNIASLCPYTNMQRRSLRGAMLMGYHLDTCHQPLERVSRIRFLMLCTVSAPSMSSSLHNFTDTSSSNLLPHLHGPSTLLSDTNIRRCDKPSQVLGGIITAIASGNVQLWSIQ